MVPLEEDEFPPGLYQILEMLVGRKVSVRFLRYNLKKL
jgi:hypothetical protein